MRHALVERLKSSNYKKITSSSPIKILIYSRFCLKFRNNVSTMNVHNNNKNQLTLLVLFESERFKKTIADHCIVANFVDL